MSAPLAGLTLVVTRPAAQARGFLTLARDAGARCIAFPTLEIEHLPLAPESHAAVKATAWDWVIWTSANAVDAAFEELGPIRARRHAAVGRATARALERHGVTAELRPGSANSEGLLALRELREVAGLAVLLVKGAGGRDLIRSTLEARGARVAAVELYRRRRAEPSNEASSALRAALGDVRVAVAVTSVEVLEALLQIAPPDVLDRLRDCTLLVPGARVAAAAAGTGWRGTLVQAETAEDGAMLQALADWAQGPAPAA